MIQWQMNLQVCVLSIAVSSADLYNVHWWKRSVHNFKIAVLLLWNKMRLKRTTKKQCCAMHPHRDACS